MMVIFRIVVLALAVASCASPAKVVDLLIKGAMVVDGRTDSPGQLDIGILGDRIAFVGKAESSTVLPKEILLAENMYLSPGFIDPHTHLDRDLSDPEENANLSALMQGVTTIIGGNDGGSPLPIGRKLDEWERNGLGTNVALLVGMDIYGSGVGWGFVAHRGNGMSVRCIRD